MFILTNSTQMRIELEKQNISPYKTVANADGTITYIYKRFELDRANILQNFSAKEYAISSRLSF